MCQTIEGLLNLWSLPSLGRGWILAEDQAAPPSLPKSSTAGEGQNCPPGLKALALQSQSLSFSPHADVLKRTPWAAWPSNHQDVGLDLLDVLHCLVLAVHGADIPA